MLLINEVLYAKLSKCELHKINLDYLGYQVLYDGIEMNPGKVKAILEWQALWTCKQLQSFLGFVNLYKQFIPSFAKIPLLITELFKIGGVG